MDKATLDNLLKMLSSENDADAVMGLRGMQGLLRVEKIDLGRALQFILDNKEQLQDKAPALVQQKAVAKLEISGTPQCFSPKSGMIEIVVPGQTSGEPVQLPTAAAQEGETIALNLKDALVAAAINKSRFKLKLLDIKNDRGDIVETLLQAEYERKGMVPVPIWANIRGEVAALATVLRRAVSASMPELVAA